MTTTEELWVDPRSGEVLTQAQRRELVEELGSLLIHTTRERRRLAEAEQQITERLGALMLPGDAVAEGGWAVAVKPAPTPARQIVPHALEEHSEALAPLGLAPRDETKVTRTYAKVGDLTSPAAREALARVGLAPELFIFSPERGPDRVVVIAPKDDER